ncbi:transposase family protein [Streptomyces sp. NPDC048106]|uniref:transposase family protein n=1 Tax=Streptomyces sp. NPDC048106 TaxID=3155750 RepID=UPI00345419B6
MPVRRGLGHVAQGLGPERHHSLRIGAIDRQLHCHLHARSFPDRSDRRSTFDAWPGRRGGVAAGGRHPPVRLIIADEQARACHECGVFATRVNGSATTRPRDLPYGESALEFRWRKRRWRPGARSRPARP